MTEEIIQAIDVHAHFGKCVGGISLQTDEFMSADADELIRRARIANTRLTIASPLGALFPRLHGNPEAANIEAAEAVSKSAELLQWVVVDPRKPKTFEQALEMLAQPKCVGIKIHPEEHGYHITDYGQKLFAFAESHNAIIQTHSGEEKSLPADFVKFANAFPKVRLIISHLGFGFDDDLTYQVRAIQNSKHGNIFTDTSRAKSIVPNLIEWAVGEIGAEHILYGTDSPLYFAPMQRARIDYADISDHNKRLILHDNAAMLFALLKD